MKELNYVETLQIDGGRIESVSDVLLLGGSIAFCFVCPQIAVPATIVMALW